MIIGISGNATSGKDTLFRLLNKILLEEYNVESRRLALADDLKLEINDFCKKNYGISAFTKDSQEKEFIRPLMVTHGFLKRKETFGKYWTNLLQPKINNLLNENLVPIITDIRYNFYENDEVFWLKSVNNGVLIHVTRYDNTGIRIKPCNKDEEENEPKLIKMADFSLNWPSSNDDVFLSDLVKTQLRHFFKKYEKQ